jgi:hypothetical protein
VAFYIINTLKPVEHALFMNSDMVTTYFKQIMSHHAGKVNLIYTILIAHLPPTQNE